MSSSNQNNPSENNPSRSNQSRKGKGRQKVNMVKIENETNLQVTFSKRRAGLFKKASELSTLCGAETAIVVFSPGDKAHSFGNPNVETIANRFLNQENNVPPRNEHADQLLRAHSEANMRLHNQELINLESQLELEKKRKQELDNMRKANQGQPWCPPNIDELNYEELEQLKRAVLNFKQEFEAKVQNATNLAGPYMQGTNPEGAFPFDPNVQRPNQFGFYGGNAPLALGGPTNPNPFAAGGSSSNVAFPTNTGANNSTMPLFPGFVNPGPGINATPFDPAVANNFGATIQYPGTASSDAMFPYNYGNPGDAFPYGGGTNPGDAFPYGGGTNPGGGGTNPGDAFPYGGGTRGNDSERETQRHGKGKWQAGSSSNYRH